MKPPWKSAFGFLLAATSIFMVSRCSRAEAKTTGFKPSIRFELPVDSIRSFHCKKIIELRDGNLRCESAEIKLNYMPIQLLEAMNHQ